jgi:antitoxin (DNA-binding transcriptional repressor) of toxin-antitoxin stability system
MNRVTIAELTTNLAEILRAVRTGESFEIVDRNGVIAQIRPMRDRHPIRIRKPAPGSPAPNKVALPNLRPLKIDVLQFLLGERQSHR